MSQQIQTLLSELDACSNRAKSLLGTGDQLQLTKRPPNGGWSAVECVKHLTLTTGLYLDVLPPLISDARVKGKIGDGPFRMDWKGAFLKWILEPPYRTRVKTVKSLEVVTSESPDKVLVKFFASQSNLKTIYESARGIALDKVTMRSPFNERMSYNLYSCFCLIIAHQRRHLWQGEQARLRVQ